MTNPALATSDDAVRFPSLDSLRAAHSALLRDYRVGGGTGETVERIKSFILRGKATGAVLDTEADRWTAQSQLDYWATKLYEPGHEPLDATLDEFDPQLAPELEDRLCPYVGLDAFGESNLSFFYGRERVVEALLRKLKESRFLAVLGSSGSGKSSVVRAGLVPALKGGALPGSATWHYFAPLVPGSTPLTNLARLMKPADADSAKPDEDAERYRQDSASLARMIAKGFPGNAVLVVDQFEEVFTLCTDEVARRKFVQNLIALSRTPAAEHRVIITMRLDFEAAVSLIPELQELFERSDVRITPLNAGELRDAIERPAARIGLKFEEGVVDALLNDILGEPAALPLLQFTLLKLWEKRERNRITWEAYRKLGGGRETLARSADELYNSLIPEEKVTMRRILLKMVRPMEGLEVTSNRVPRAVLYQKAEANDRIDRVLGKLIGARLVRVSEGDIAADEQVEVAHEALVRNWPRLGGWLEDERSALRQRQRLTAAAREWERLRRNPSALWRGILLDEALRYDDLTGPEAEFLQAGHDAEKSELRKLQERAAQLRRRSLYLTGALVLALIAIGAAAFLGIRANTNRVLAETNAKAVRAQVSISEAVSLALQSLVFQVRDRNYPLAFLLGVEAFRRADTPQTRGTLLDNAQANPQLDAVLDRHTAEVNSIAFSPDGKILASGSEDGTVIFWDVATRLPLGPPLRPHVDTQFNAAFNPLGMPPAGPALGSVLTVAFSPDGKLLASGGQDGTITLWDVATRHRSGDPLNMGTSYVESVAFSPDGSILASAGNGTIFRWDMKSRIQLGQPIDGNAESITRLAFSPDGKTLASGRDKSVMFWDVQTGQPLGQTALLAPTWVSSLAFRPPDGTTLASGSSDGTIILWDMATTRPRSSFRWNAAGVSNLAFSRDGQLLASGLTDGSVVVWNVSTLPPEGHTLFSGHTGEVGSVAFSSDGQTLASASSDHTIMLWDVLPRQLVGQALTGSAARVDAVAFSPDGKILASGGPLETRLWDVATGRPLDTPLLGASGPLAFSPDGKILASGGRNATVVLWDVATQQPIGPPLDGHTIVVSSLAFSPDGKILASGSQDTTIILWDVATWKPIGQPLRGHTDRVYAVAFSPDGKILASGSEDKKIILWDVATWQPMGPPLTGHEKSVNSVAFRPDGKIMASGSDDKTIILWDVATRKPIGQPLRGHAYWVKSLAFSPDGKTLVSGSVDTSIILWDLASRQPIGQPLRRHRYWVSSVAFSPNGKLLASGGQDPFLVLWDMDPVSWARQTCRRAGRNFTQDEWQRYFPNEKYRVTCPEWPPEPQFPGTPTAAPSG